MTEQGLLAGFLAAQEKLDQLEHVVVVDGPGGTATLEEVKAGARPDFDFDSAWQTVEAEDLKMSTRQRTVAIELDFPPPETERTILVEEAGVDPAHADDLVRLGQAVRRLKDSGLREVASTRALIATGALVREGLPLRDAAIAAIAGPLTDDPELREGLIGLIDSYVVSGEGGVATTSDNDR